MDEQTSKVTARLNEIRQLLKDYDVKIGLGQLLANNEVNKYLNIKQSELRKFPAIECGEASVIINQAAAYVQSETNKHQAIVNWCQRSITKLIAVNVHEYGSQYTPFEYRKELAIKDNELANEINDVMVKEQLRVDAMAFIATALRALSSSFESLQQTKRSMKT